MKKVRRGCLGCVAVPLFLAAGIAAWFRWQLNPVSAAHRSLRVVVRPGERGPQVARLLQRRGVIRNARVFYWYAMWRGAAASLKAGDYRLSPDMTPDEVLDRLKRGGTDSDERTVTIPEGFTVRQIAEALHRKGVIGDERRFVEVVRDADTPISAPFPLPKAGLEGYLFPDTYRFRANSRPEAVAQTMVDTFSRRFYAPYKDDIARSKHDLNQIVTIASLIEREAEVEADRPRIAGVIENRLARKMPLGIDASVLYALGRHKSRVLYSDLRVDSPYNTYRHVGLPPGPIASPGLPSLRAALAPERHDYLYYVAAPDGSHVFTRTEAEHLRAVARMRALARDGRSRPAPTVAPGPG